MAFALGLYQELRYLFLLSTCTDELRSASNITTSLPNAQLDNEKDPSTSNKIQYSEYEYLSGSGFLVNLTPPYKEFLNLKLFSL